MAFGIPRNSPNCGSTSPGSDAYYCSDKETDERASDEDAVETHHPHHPGHSTSSRTGGLPSTSQPALHSERSDERRSRRATTPPPPQQQQQQQPRHYSVSELVRTLGNHDESTTCLPPEMERRTLDFRLAQSKRRTKYGAAHHLGGVYGLYQHLSSVRIDLEWAEDAAWRRQNGEPYLSWQDFDEARLQGIRNVPWFTYSLVLICSIMMIVEFGVNNWKVEPLSVNPMIGPSADTLIKLGARNTIMIVADGEWYRLFAPLILHAGLIHYFINMLALWFIGKAVEQNHGVLNTLVMFMVPGVGANILSAIFLPEYISVGASGGLFGLIGACVTDIAVNWKILSIRKPDETERQVWRRNAIALVILVVEITINLVSDTLVVILYFLPCEESQYLTSHPPHAPVAVAADWAGGSVC